MRWSVGFLLAASLCVTAVSAIPAQTRVPLFGRTLVFGLPDGMVLANEKRNDTNVLIEYLPKGENLSNWTRLVTIQAYRGLGASPATTAQIARQAFYPAACTKGPLYSDSGEKPFAAKLKRSLIINGCASLPAGAYPKALPGAGEQDFIMMFRDADTIYTLNYAVRGKTYSGKPPPVAIGDAEALLRATFGNVTL
jgi:hypothetical protein